MRLIVDANILFSALYKPDSRAGALVMYAFEEKVSLLSTEHMYVEMMRICVDKLGYSNGGAWDVINHLPVEWVEAEIYHDRMPQSLLVTADKGDASLIALADLIGLPVVTGDKGLLRIDGRHGLRIIRLDMVVEAPGRTNIERK